MADDRVNAVSPPQRIRSTQYRDVYANSTNLRMGPFDVTFVFGQLTEAPPGSGITAVEDQVGITISPQHLKNLAFVFVETLRAWEEAFGEIPLPADATLPKFKASEIAEKLRQGIKAEFAAGISSEKQRPSRRSRAASEKKA